jgi:hypothetical protein
MNQVREANARTARFTTESITYSLPSHFDG